MRGFLRRVFYSTQEAGRGKDRQIFLLDTSKNKISFWNDVPFKNENTGKDIFNGVIEISKNLTAKLEMAKNEKYHPLKFNEKTKKVRVAIGKHFYHLKQGFFNYGFIPQTWESPLLPNKEVLSTYVYPNIGFLTF